MCTRTRAHTQPPASAVDYRCPRSSCSSSSSCLLAASSSQQARRRRRRRRRRCARQGRQNSRQGGRARRHFLYCRFISLTSMAWGVSFAPAATKRPKRRRCGPAAAHGRAVGRVRGRGAVAARARHLAALGLRGDGCVRRRSKRWSNRRSNRGSNRRSKAGQIAGQTAGQTAGQKPPVKSPVELPVK